MTWTADTALVRTPATSANLGPGFDALGMALTLYDEVEAAIAGHGISIEISGEGSETAGLGEDHLVVVAMRAAFARIAALAEDSRGGAGPEQPAGIRLRCVNRIPHGRGLGSSAAATVAGILAARALHPDGNLLDDQAVLTLATEMEGHPDNAAPCLAGGLTIAWATSDGPRMVRLDVAESVALVVFVPERRLSTEAARGLLPETVRHADAAGNAGRAALLVAALTSGLAPEVLLDATEDQLHQPYRAPAMPESAELLSQLRATGVPAVISGAGPSILAFTTTSPVDSIGDELGNGWHKHPLNVAPQGACVRLAGS